MSARGASVFGRAIAVVGGLVVWACLQRPTPAWSQAPQTPSHPATPSVTQTRIVLPLVPRSEPAQPTVGGSSDSHLNKTPPRNTKGLDLVKAGWSYNCMECHKLFPAKWRHEGGLNEHKNIQLDHGNNRFCLNCHHSVNRTAFVDYDGAEIQEADVVQLCAKCHGTTHRDWKAGVHGRENGFWNAKLGEKTQLRCIQCHDPHSPKFKPVKPLPPLRYPVRGANPEPPHSAPSPDHKP